MDKIKTLMVLAMVLVMAGFVSAASFRPLPEQEQAHIGATHVATITHADLTETNVDTAQTLTNVFVVAAKQGVQLVAMQLITAFDAGNNATGSVCVTVGDGTDTDLYLTSTELNSNLTEVWLKFGRSVQAETSGSLIYAKTNAPTVTLTLQTVSLTDTNGVTALCVTNVTGTATLTACTNTVLSALTDDSTGRKVYTAADTVDFVFTPNSANALSENTAGEVRFYFKVIR